MQSPADQMVALELSSESAPRSKLGNLCSIANNHADPDAEWVDWLNLLALDAEALLDDLERAKEVAREAGSKKSEIEKLIRYKRESRKPSMPARVAIADALQDYTFQSRYSFDARRCRVMRADTHNAPTKQLVAFALALAIRDGEWRAFRRCRLPECGKLFIDDPGRGQPPSRHCSKKHAERMKKRIQRGESK